MKREAISKLCDFFLMKESPLYESNKRRTEMGNTHVNPKFSGLICAVSTLVRHCYTKYWTKEHHERKIIPPTLIEGPKVILL